MPTRPVLSVTWARAIRMFWVSLLLGLLAACGGEGHGGRGGGGNAGAAGTGQVTVSLTDAPACGFSAVNITVTKVRIHASSSAGDGDSGWTELPLSPPKRVNLLELTNGVLETLARASLAPGQYTQIRLVLQASAAGTAINSVVPRGGVEQVLDTPSGIESGIKLVSSFTVAAGQTADVVLDFDACKSVVRRGNGTYLLKPVIRVIAAATGGAVTGNVPVGPAFAGAVVSAQKAGVVVRSTIADAGGAFTLSPVPAANSPYDVVITAPGFASAMIADVPVSAGTTTRVSPVGSAIVLPASVMRSVSGTVLPLDAEASVNASQRVGANPVEIGYANVSPSGTYALTLPVAAPILAVYSTILPLSFADRLGVAARYTIGAEAEDHVSQEAEADLGTADAALDFTLLPKP